MSFESFLADMKHKAKCPKCDKPYDVFDFVDDKDNNNLIVRMNCHGEDLYEQIPRAEIEELEARRERTLKAMAKKPTKKRTVIVDDSMRHFAKFKKVR